MASSSTILCKPRCRVCNNLVSQGHQDTDLERNTLELPLAFPKLDRDCPFCRLVIFSVELAVDKDCWNARIINAKDGKEEGTLVVLYLMENRPITCEFAFCHGRINHTGPNGHNTGSSSEDGISVVGTRFLIYSGDEVPFSPKLCKKSTLSTN